jgi:multisubunit Na+/H+ antiporter MnhB subunit
VEDRREIRQMTVYIIVGVIVIIVGSLWLWGPAKVFGTLFFWWIDSDDD